MNDPEKSEFRVQTDTTGSMPTVEKGDEPTIHSQSLDEAVDTSFQQGVQEIEAVTISWTKSSMITAYILIWMVYFVQNLTLTVTGALLPYVTSAFAAHSLTATTGVVSAVVGGVSNLSFAKVLDVFGRPHGFLLGATFATVGLIMSAACNNVEAYVASQVFSTVGINGFGYALSVFIADTTSLRYRGLVQALCASPSIITAWLGGPISNTFLDGAGWRWGFGMLSILVPAVTLPLFGLLIFYHGKAKKAGLLPQRERRSLASSTSYYVHEFDLPGLLFLSAGVAFFLLPFNLYTVQARRWSSGLVIGFLVAGVLLLCAFVIWEKFFAQKSFIPWKLIKDRTVAGACLLSFTLFLSNSCWGLYFSSILQVVNEQSVTRASWIVQMQGSAGPVFAVLTGALISYTKRFKNITIYFAIPLLALGTGLLIHFNTPESSIGYTVMCMLFLTAGGSAITITDEIAILAAVKEQQYFAVAIALVSMVGSVGSAVGLTISSAIWQDVLPKSLAKYLPTEDLPNLVMIYSDISTQLSYPPGSPGRLAIQRAYGDTQRYLFTAAVASLSLAFAGSLLWRNMNVASMKQTKGQVF